MAADGGGFTFGNAAFYGSLGGNPPPDPVTAMAAHGNNGYWVVEQNGTVHAFGSATVYAFSG